MAIIIPIGVDTSGLKKLNTAGAKLRAFGKIAAVAAGAAAVGGLVKTLEIGTQKFIAQEKAVAQTNARLKSTGSVAKVTARDVVALSDAIADKTGVDDDQIHAASNMLLTFTKIRNEVGENNDIFNRATQTVVDLSIAFEKDLNSSAIMLGKALNDPVLGITALSRAGVQFTEQQKKTIKSLVDSGKTLDAQKMILAELETQVGGSGEAFGETLPGQLSKARQSFEVVAQSLAAKFIPGIASALKSVTDFLSALGRQPTFRAKIEFILGGIRDAAGRAFRNLIDWWTTTQRTELPAQVIIKPAGREQVARFMADLQRKMEQQANAVGQNVGRVLARALVGGFSDETGKSRGRIISVLFKNFTGGYAIDIGKNLATGVWQGFTAEMNRLGESWPSIIRRIINLYNPFEQGRNIGGTLWNGVTSAIRGRRGASSLSNVITQAVRDAIQSTRQSLAGMAGTLGGLVGEIIGGSSPEAKRLREIRAQQAREQREREEARLREAVAQAASDDERRIAQQELDDWLLDQEAQRLEEQIQQNQAAANQQIADLTESFNQGLISADQFSASLQQIIGPDRGAELGAAFAGAFDRELQTILNTARDIFAIIGTGSPLAPGAGTEVSGALRAENERRFNEALGKWTSRRDNLTASLRDAISAGRDEDSPGGKDLTAAEKKKIDKIKASLAAHAKKKPQRRAYGLAAGGILTAPTFVAGEAGKEAVIPLESRSAAKILRDALGGGRASQTTVVNVTVQGSVTSEADLAENIRKQLLRTGQRNGTIFGGLA